MNTAMSYLKSRWIELTVIGIFLLTSLWPRLAPTTPITPSNIEPLSYSYPWTWSNRVVVRTAAEHCSDSWFGSSWHSQDKSIVKWAGGNAYEISYQKGISVSVEKGSKYISDIIYFRSTANPGVWKLKNFQFTDPLLLSMAQSEIEDIHHTAYAQAFVTRKGDKKTKTVDIYCYPGKE